MRRITFWVLAIVMLPRGIPARGETLTISAAISLKESLTQIRTDYEASSGDKLVYNFDASGKLASQIDQGAPVDLFISADNDQMNKLDKSGLIIASTRRVLVENSLVLIVSPSEKNAPASFADLVMEHGKKIAVGEPKTVPAGRYAMQTLKALRVDQAISPRLLYGESVRAVLSYVEQDEVCAGIVYSTDAKQAGAKVKIIATADPSTHDAIEYPGAVVIGSLHRQSAGRFLDYLSSKAAEKVFTDKGFTLPIKDPAATQPVASPGSK